MSLTLHSILAEIITLSAFEEIAPGVSLISINSKEIIFDKKGESLIAINFKNQVKETAEPF